MRAYRVVAVAAALCLLLTGAYLLRSSLQMPGGPSPEESGDRVAASPRANVPRTLAEVAARAPIPLRPISPGVFTMGIPEKADKDFPAHSVTISYPFLMGVTEVTQRQFLSVQEWSRSVFKGADFPEEYVYPETALHFCHALTESERAKGNLPPDLEYRLPTEEEWEYCCRAGTDSEFFFAPNGKDSAADLDKYAWCEANSDEAPHSVGKKKPNPWGLCDMYGNVAEWCLVWTDSPASPGSRQLSEHSVVFRGGSFWSGGEDCNSVVRGHPYMAGENYIGFRVVVAPGLLWENTVNAKNAARDKVFQSIHNSLVALPPGTFLMGGPDGGEEDGASPDARRVTISYPFQISSLEITKKQFNQIFEGWGNDLKDPDDFPARNVPACMAEDFCRTLTEHERDRGSLPPGIEYRLPTEAEWEYACRADTTTKYFFGDDPKLKPEYSWSHDMLIHPVGLKKPNPWGLCDMYGNVAEWCHGSGTACPPEGDSAVDPLGDGYVLRGGSYFHALMNTGSSWRSDTENPVRNNPFIGFRVVLGPTVPLKIANMGESTNTQPPRDTSIPMADIPAGSFVMGSDNGDPSEAPAHRVTITHPFRISVSKITKGQYVSIMGQCVNQDNDPKEPVEYVTWLDAMSFCRLLTKQQRRNGTLPAGIEYRLPTEAEWEYACRAGTTTKFFFGDAVPGLDAAKTRDEIYSANHDAALKQNPWGLVGLYHFPSEWCLDWYGEYPDNPESDTLGPGEGKDRVVRGIPFYSEGLPSSASRRGVNPDDPMADSIGFRIVLAPAQNSEPDAESALKIMLVTIPAGTFRMGTEKLDTYSRPVRNVTITRPFSMGATPVTQAQYEALMGEHVSSSTGDDLPVDSISWLDAMEFCRRLTEQKRLKGGLPAGMVYRLPTEAEWEYACRAGTTTEFFFGDDPKLMAEYVTIGRRLSSGQLHPVASLKPNPWGLFDMYGQPREWCLDWFDLEYAPGGQTDPLGPSFGKERVLRGGRKNYPYDDELGGSGYRSSNKPGTPSGGLRVVLGPIIDWR